MREREREQLEEANVLVEKAISIIGALLETRNDVDEDDYHEYGGVSYDLRMLYSSLHLLCDDIEEIKHEL
jgi:hypothetical protein